ncbi:MAG TPA: UDP-glucose/GDP-mannose dehydrogenase family protein [Actinomycetota bacterium]|nr:UDP-glucose/GDP-mannose dehydrogenase family protein [Actinomycetota bacterium]
MRLAVIGLGHVGLPTAGVLAHLGHEVSAVDVDEEKIELLQRGIFPFFEPELEDLVRQGVEAGRLTFSQWIEDAVSGVGVAFLCVGTPPNGAGQANLSIIEAAAAQLAESVDGPLVVVEKSTVPAGTAERIAQTLQRHRPDGVFAVVSNPEFLREGSAVKDSIRPSRILVGSDDPEALATMRELYAPLVEAGVPWIETDLRTAELAKHASNAFLALKVSYANALARICEAAGADVSAVAQIMGADSRIGRGHLSAGIGFGGYCLPKDVQAFEHLSRQLGYDFPLLREIARINDEAMDAGFRKIQEALWNLTGKRVAVLGLAFKPNTDDTRFSPALELSRRLIEAGADVVGYDPEAGTNAKAEVSQLEVVGDVYSALEGAHCAVLATDWDEFRTLDLVRVRELMRFPILVDGRNLFDSQEVRAAGITYIPTGRPPVRP